MTYLTLPVQTSSEFVSRTQLSLQSRNTYTLIDFAGLLCVLVTSVGRQTHHGHTQVSQRTHTLPYPYHSTPTHYRTHITAHPHTTVPISLRTHTLPYPYHSPLHPRPDQGKWKFVKGHWFVSVHHNHTQISQHTHTLPYCITAPCLPSSKCTQPSLTRGAVSGYIIWWKFIKGPLACFLH